MFAQPASVESLLGVPPSSRTSALALAASIEKGLPVSALDRLAGFVAPDDAHFRFRLIPKATLERRKRSPTKRLTREEGDRLARLAKVVSFALEVFREPDAVRAFLAKPHAMLDNKAPLEVALSTGPGADAVINLLGRAAYSGGA